MANWSQEAVERLADTVSQRRRHLGRSQIEVWERGGPSNSTMTSIENAASTSVTPATLRKLDVGLSWVAGTAAGVLNGDVPAQAPIRDIRYDSRTGAEMGDDPGIRTERADSAHPLGERVAAQLKTDLNDFVALVAALSVDADDIANTARGLSTPFDNSDEDEVETFVSDVEWLVSEIEDFVGSVDVVAKMVFGGDVERLRRLKRDTKRLRRQHAATQPIEGLQSEYDLADAERRTAEKSQGPPPELADAARTAPPGYTPGQPEQGDADGEGSQIDPREEK